MGTNHRHPGIGWLSTVVYDMSCGEYQPLARLDSLE